jgi:hypothetical protein
VRLLGRLPGTRPSLALLASDWAAFPGEVFRPEYGRISCFAVLHRGRTLGAIIRAVNKRRQRAALWFVTTLAIFGTLVGCEARSSIEAAQTAVVVAQTALPGAQATALAAATQVTSVLPDARTLLPSLQLLLAGAMLEVVTSPPDAAPDGVTAVTIRGTDTSGTLTQLDTRARQAAASAALLMASNYYPNASITLTVADGSGTALLSGTKSPGRSPELQ